MAKRVVNTRKVMKGNVLDLELQEAKVTSEKSGGDENVEKSILVCGLPEGVTEKEITIHFQKKKIGRGEIAKVIVLSGNTALVLFEDAEG